jgi:hypothetical protein
MYRLLIGFCTAASIGCGSDTSKPPSFGSEDGKAIAQLVSQFNEDKHEPNKLKKLFVGGKSPADWKQFDKYDFQLDGNPKIEGDTATAILKKRDAANADAGSTTFTFAKDGGSWKIKTAPLS